MCILLFIDYGVLAEQVMLLDVHSSCPMFHFTSWVRMSQVRIDRQ